MKLSNVARQQTKLEQNLIHDTIKWVPEIRLKMNNSGDCIVFCSDALERPKMFSKVVLLKQGGNFVSARFLTEKCHFVKPKTSKRHTTSTKLSPGRCLRLRMDLLVKTKEGDSRIAEGLVETTPCLIQTKDLRSHIPANPLRLAAILGFLFFS